MSELVLNKGASNKKASKKVLALSGGVGGAKLALGLAQILLPEQLTIVANTADDFELMGLPISPDLDTVMYTLAGLNNQQQGWGLAGETWSMMEAMETLGGETWFQLGDKDIATHLRRGQLLAEGKNLTEVTEYLAQQLGVKHSLLPMSNDPVRTFVQTDEGELGFQDYFVRRQCEPVVNGFHFKGLDTAQPSIELMALLTDSELDAIVVCPSNPFVSVDPILKLPSVAEAIKASPAKVIAISPIVAGMAIKGPAAKMMKELNMPVTADAVARHYANSYGDLLDLFVVDSSDADLAASIESEGTAVAVTSTVMKSLADKQVLAEFLLRQLSPEEVEG